MQCRYSYLYWGGGGGVKWREMGPKAQTNLRGVLSSAVFVILAGGAGGHAVSSTTTVSSSELLILATGLVTTILIDFGV